MSSSSPIQLTSLFSKPLLLAYAVPLLLISILLTFSGAFLTLDRTRTFAPRSDAVESLPGALENDHKSKRFTWRLEGGIGGLAGGYAFGLHASTFLSLLIMNTTSSSPLGDATFLVVWLLSVTLTTFLAGRWRFIALAFIGITGGATLALSLCIIMHPALLSRIILLAIITTFALVITILPLPRAQHVAARILASAAGAFGTILAIALLANPQIPSWANAWERLWTSSSLQWGTSQERGLDAAFCALWAAGAACDWVLKRRFGEDPDQKWDAYLADYASNLPNAHDRAGTFQPLQSWWTKLTSKHASLKALHTDPMLFPSDDMMKATSSLSHLSKEELQHKLPGADVYAWEPSPPPRPVLQKVRSSAKSFGFDIADAAPPLTSRPTFLTKASHRHKRKPKQLRTRGVQFRPLGGFSSSSGSDSDSDADDDVLKTPQNMKPWAPRAAMDRKNSTATFMSGTTLEGDGERDAGFNVEKEKARIGGVKAALGESQPEYSDLEEEDVAVSLMRRPSRDVPGWKPDFIARSQSQSHSSSSSSSNPKPKIKSRRSNTSPPPPLGAVPVTPSLIHALGRIAAAQDEAYGSARAGLPLSPVPQADDDVDEGSGGKRWEAFWRDVGETAAANGPRA